MQPAATSLPQNAFFLLGSTAVGKSELAVQLAERIGGEIVGADAFQIYEGLDILSAKPDAALLRRIPHHLISEVPLARSYDVAAYREAAIERIAAIAQRGSVPIICGGNGLYVRALTHGLSSEMPVADAALRAGLEKEAITVLVERLRALDPNHTVDEKNLRRVVRALEVCIVTGQPFSSFRQEWDNAPSVRGVILSRPREELLTRIARRTEEMFAAGVVVEVAGTKGIGPTAGQMLGLREIQSHIAGDLSLVACKTALAIGTRQYAKRQGTWFRRERGFPWMDLSTEPEPLTRLTLMATIIS